MGSLELCVEGFCRRMRPFQLTQGSRPVTHVVYSRDGDCLYSGSKDSSAAMWYTHNGERVGTFDGHKGAVNALAVNFDTTRMLTAASDSTSILWNALTGEELFKFHHEVAVKFVDYSLGDELSLHVTDNIMGKAPALKIYRMADDLSEQLDVPVREIVCKDFPEKVHQARFGAFNETIVSVDGFGRIQKWDTETGKLLEQKEVHDGAVVAFSFDENKLQMITASLDCTAVLWDVKTLNEVKRYETNIPVRAVSISPYNDHVILAGGQDAKDVATKRMGSDNSQFAVRFYHKIFGDLIGSVKGGFSTVTSLTFSPDGKGFCVGFEEGSIRLYRLNDEYFEKYSKEADIAAIQLPPQ